MGSILIQSAGRLGPKEDLLGHDLGAYRWKLHSCSWKPRIFPDLKLHAKSPRANIRYKRYAPVLLCGTVWVEELRVQMPAARVAYTLLAILHLFLTVFRVQIDYGLRPNLELRIGFLVQRGFPNTHNQYQIRKQYNS